MMTLRSVSALMKDTSIF